MSDCKLVPVEPTQEMIDAARQHHEGEAYLPVSLYKAMIAAAPAVQGEPVAYAVFADNGNIRIWSADPIQAKTLIQEYGDQVQPLYTAPKREEQQPAPDVQGLVEALQAADEYLSNNKFNQIGSGSILRRQMQDALAAYRKQETNHDNQ